MKNQKGKMTMKYSKELKEEALKLSDEIGLKKAAQQLGIQYYTLSDWRSKRSAAIKARKYQMSDEELKQRNLELEKEVAELRKANDILKDAGSSCAAWHPCKPQNGISHNE